MRPSRRRWFQFSLRTLFVALTVCAVASPAIPLAVARYRRWRHPINYTTVKPWFDPPLAAPPDYSPARQTHQPD
jgi:hypothetical protein